MRNVGLPITELGRCSGTQSLIICVNGRRRPNPSDTNYPLLTMWRVDSDDEQNGEVWQLVAFKPNGATWAMLQYNAGCPSISSIFTEDLETARPNAYGTLKLGTKVVNDYRKAAMWKGDITGMDLCLQTASAVDEPRQEYLGLSSFNRSDFDVKNGFVSLLGDKKAGITGIGVNGKHVYPNNSGQVHFCSDPNDGVSIELISNKIWFTSKKARATSKEKSASKLGVAAFNGDEFLVEDGFVSLLPNQRRFKSIRLADSNEIIDPNKEGELSIGSIAIPQREKPVSISREGTGLRLKIQTATAQTDDNRCYAGLAYFDERHFNVNQSGKVALAHDSYIEGPHNLKLIADGATIHLVGADCKLLSKKNYGYYVKNERYNFSRSYFDSPQQVNLVEFIIEGKRQERQHNKIVWIYLDGRKKPAASLSPVSSYENLLGHAFIEFDENGEYGVFMLEPKQWIDINEPIFELNKNTYLPEFENESQHVSFDGNSIKFDIELLEAKISGVGAELAELKRVFGRTHFGDGYWYLDGKKYPVTVECGRIRVTEQRRFLLNSDFTADRECTLKIQGELK